MKKSLIILFILLLIAPACGKKDSIKNNNLEEKPKVQEVDINSLVFPLYKHTRDDYTYYNNPEIYVIESDNIVIDTTKKMVIDFNKKELLDYNKFIKENPLGDIRNFVLLNNRCRQEIYCDDEFGCTLPNYGIEALQEEIDPINGVTPDYLVEEWCPIEISEEIINQINNLEGVQVLGRELPNMDNKIVKNSVAINLLSENKIAHLNELFYNYGLLNPYQYSVKGYTKYNLRPDICERMQLKCEKID